MNQDSIQSPSRPKKELSDALIRVGLFLVVLLFFLPSLSYDFLNWDDHQYIHRNPWLLAFHVPNVIGIFSHSYFLNYHPLTILSYMIDFQLYGYDAAGYRLGNIILHGLTVVVGFGILRRLGVSRVLAGLGLLWFAVHPLRVESVVWISERKDVLCGLFYLLAFRLYLETKEFEGKSQVGFYLGCLVCFVLALLSKAMAITFPVVLICYDIVISRKVSFKQVLFYLVGIILSIVFAGLNMQSQTEAIGEAVPLFYRLKMAFYAPWHYSMTTLVPVGLSPLYPNQCSPVLSTFWVVLGAGFSLVMGCLAVFSFWKQRWLSFGLFAAVVVLAPVSGIVAFGSAWAADRYSYLPTFFLLVGVIVVVQSFWERWGAMQRKTLVVFASLHILFCAVITVQYMPHWRNSETVWARVLTLYPESSIAQLNAAHSVLKKDQRSVGKKAGDIADKVQSLEPARAIEAYTLLQEGRIDEALAVAESIPEKDLSLKWQLRVLHDGGRTDDAVQLVAKQSEILESLDPENLAYMALILAEAKQDEVAGELLSLISQPTMKGAFARGLLAESALQRGDYTLAEYHAWRGLMIFPAEFKSVQVMGKVCQEDGREKQAIKVYWWAAHHPAVKPMTKSYSLVQMGKIYQGQGRTDKARKCFSKAFDVPRLGDENEMTVADYNYLGFLAEEVGMFEVADGFYEDILNQQPDHLDAMLGRAFVNIRQGNREKAIGILEKAVALHPESVEAKQNLEVLRNK